ncbi:MAG: hypothetical protein Q7I99_04600 [Acholeplasmataceae bacterium]|nr:hypothetical protein [Acholeplasmataceae bacterium]
MNRRIVVGLTTGAILGVVCIIGAHLRFGATLSAIYLFSFWYNRVLMGLVIGLFVKKHKLSILLLRGALTGALISFAFYGATEFNDLIGFLAGIAYGVIIEFVLYKLVK